jgi:hypothetical protein
MSLQTLISQEKDKEFIPVRNYIVGKVEKNLPYVFSKEKRENIVAKVVQHKNYFKIVEEEAPGEALGYIYRKKILPEKGKIVRENFIKEFWTLKSRITAVERQEYCLKVTFLTQKEFENFKIRIFQGVPIVKVKYENIFNKT